MKECLRILDYFYLHYLVYENTAFKELVGVVTFCHLPNNLTNLP